MSSHELPRRLCPRWPIAWRPNWDFATPSCPPGRLARSTHSALRSVRCCALRRSHRERDSSTKPSRSSRSASTASGLTGMSGARPSGKPAAAWRSWEACAYSVRAAVSKASGDANAWIDAYTSKDGWFRLDQAQRRLEAWVANLDDEPEERPLGVVRGAYEDACRAMADGFTKAHRAGELDRLRRPCTRRTSTARSSRSSRSLLRTFLSTPCVSRWALSSPSGSQSPRKSSSALPSARCPASRRLAWRRCSRGQPSSFSVVEQAGTLGARIDDAFLPDLAGSQEIRRRPRAQAWPTSLLTSCLSLQPSKLAKKIDGAQVVVVRSQEIDHAGEAGFTFQARQVMDTVIDNLARAIRKLAAAGVEHAVVTRRSWPSVLSVGSRRVHADRRAGRRRGRSAPPLLDRTRRSDTGWLRPGRGVCARVRLRPGFCVSRWAAGSSKRAETSPSTMAARHLQELVIPVLTVRMKAPSIGALDRWPRDGDGPARRRDEPHLQRDDSLDGKNLSLFSSELVVRPLLISCGKASRRGRDGRRCRFRSRHRLREASAGKPVTVAFLLSDESVGVRCASSFKIPTTDAELYRSPTDIPVRLGV